MENKQNAGSNKEPIALFPVFTEENTFQISGA
jgi:hypothetical protein